jgi:hypothetical protein
MLHLLCNIASTLDAGLIAMLDEISRLSSRAKRKCRQRPLRRRARIFFTSDAAAGWRLFDLPPA